MANYSLTINNRRYDVANVEPDTPILWILRDTLGLVGTKYGCGIAECGACTIHLNDNPARACSLPISAVSGMRITTIEGLSDGDVLHPLQQSWIDNDVPQCGYCQAGQIMAAAALLNRNSTPTDKEIDAAMEGNLCRCGTYHRIRQSIRDVANANRKKGANHGQTT